MATVTREFKGCEDGQLYPRTFKPGDRVDGRLARVAIENGWATDGESKKKPDRNKSDAPARNKDAGSGSASRPGRA